MNSEQLFEKSLKYVPGGVHSPVRSFKGLHTTPRFIKSGKGAYITDEEGNEYIDFCMSFGPLILGHQNPQVKEAILKSLDHGWTFGACERYSLELAEYIVERIPFIEQVRFVNSGTEAVMTAVRLARGITGKSKIIKFNGCYHGHLDGMLIKAGSGLAGTAEASSKGVSQGQANETLTCELANLSMVEKIFDDHPGEVAAIFIEPLPANNGLLPQTREYLEGLRKLCDKNQALLVFDEVISGFRMGFGGMAELTRVTPDIVTYGKIIGGGMPVGAVAGKKDIMEQLAPLGPVYQAGTLSGNPAAMRAGLATLKQLDEKTYQTLDEQAKKIANLFTQWATKNNQTDFQVIQFQSLLWMVPTKNQLKSILDIPAQLSKSFFSNFKELLGKGVYLAPNAYEVSFVSTAHNDQVIEDLKEKLLK